MGYSGHVNSLIGVGSYLDMMVDIKNTIGKKIEIGFEPDIPKDEKIYTLKDAHVGHEYAGAYIHFYLLSDNDENVEFIIKGIKNFEYEVHPSTKKYWVGVSDEPLTQYPKGFSESMSHQHGNHNYRFLLFN
ncbi:hypothetical protein [Paenibacillus sp. P32E]|uniref:hypothetical protein n=1 Tax=Paenibacillus sp. P32E TaxID=1349434 RepID=UPI00093D8BEC|nr:hypothetical protein [Paenibacillus sp. P32E]OKP91313.1 hypothetical protein A3848_09400 [Paenibacillus sp. P32E]